MEHRNRKYYENLIVVLVVFALIYGGYVYFLKNNTPKINKIVTVQKVVQPEVRIIDEEPVQEKVILEEETISQKEEVIVQEINTSTEENISIEIEPIKENIIKQKTISQKEIIIQKAKKQFVNKETLNNFLKTVKKQINSKMIIDDKIDITIQKDYLKIRITILKDGNYEELKYMEGNKILFDINKQNILKVFPVSIKEEIQDQFPRYIRHTISYRNIKDNTNNE